MRVALSACREWYQLVQHTTYIDVFWVKNKVELLITTPMKMITIMYLWYSYCIMVLTTGLDVTQIHPDLRVHGEAPGGLHLASWVTTEVLTSPELGVFLI